MSTKMTQKEEFELYIELLKVLTQPEDAKCRAVLLDKLSIEIKIL